MPDMNRILIAGRVGAHRVASPRGGESKLCFVLSTRCILGTQHHEVVYVGHDAADINAQLQTGGHCLVEGSVRYRRVRGRTVTDILASRVHVNGDQPC